MELVYSPATRSSHSAFTTLHASSSSNVVHCPPGPDRLVRLFHFFDNALTNVEKMCESDFLLVLPSSVVGDATSVGRGTLTLVWTRWRNGPIPSGLTASGSNGLRRSTPKEAGGLSVLLNVNGHMPQETRLFTYLLRLRVSGQCLRYPSPNSALDRWLKVSAVVKRDREE